MTTPNITDEAAIVARKPRDGSVSNRADFQGPKAASQGGDANTMSALLCKIQPVQRPFAWPAGRGNGHPIYDLDEWMRATRMESGMLCQVFWREQRHVNFRWKNFKTPRAAASYVKKMLDDKTVSLLDIGIAPDHPAYPGAESADFRTPQIAAASYVKEMLDESKALTMTAESLESPGLTPPVCESTIVARCHTLLATLDPDWLARMDDAHLPTADRSTIFELLQTAPDDFSRGLLYGQMLGRLELAQATGRPF